MMKSVIAIAIVASVLPSCLSKTHLRLKLFVYGDYDGKVWGQDAKDDVYAKWDPYSARSTKNFNPFETYKGNACDASGIYPGEPYYKAPFIEEATFQSMMRAKQEAEYRAAHPKPGDVPGCAGCKN